MATATKKKPAAKKKAPAKKPVAKKAPAKRAASVSSRKFVTRSDEYTQLTWVLICIWLVLIAIFLGTVVGQMG
jgi:hypothetical protein